MSSHFTLMMEHKIKGRLPGTAEAYSSGQTFLTRSLTRHYCLLLRETRKHCSAINVVRVCGQANASATTVEPSCPSPLLYKIFLQALISSDNTLHLLLVPSSIRMIAFGKRAIATFYLLLSCIWRQT